MKENKYTNLIPLQFANEEETYYISELKGGKYFKEKCINQGIIPGQKVEIKNISTNGPYIVAINDARIVIGHSMLHRVLVRQ